MIYRRILGLKPELSASIDELPREVFLPQEEGVKTVIHKDFSDAYKNTDFSGINLPIYVDGSYHGLTTMGFITNRWVDPEVCKRHGIGEEEKSVEPVAENAEDDGKVIKRKRSPYPVSMIVICHA